MTELFQSTHPAWGGTFLFHRISHVLGFQSTHPAWGGTSGSCTPGRAYQFQSTHPAWGGTYDDDNSTADPADFNPPTPHGVGLSRIISSTNLSKISIHPPRMGWDIKKAALPCWRRNFNPPTPHGVGPCCFSKSSTCSLFQSTHPAWGGTNPESV